MFKSFLWLYRSGKSIADKAISGLAPAEEEPMCPRTLTECFAYLDKILGDEDKEAIRQNTCDLHHSLGRCLRNQWGLWTHSPLQQWFVAQGVIHADDMSGIILKSYRKYLLGKPLDLEKQIQYYNAYWQKMKELSDRGVKIFQITMSIDEDGDTILNIEEG